MCRATTTRWCAISAACISAGWSSRATPLHETADGRRFLVTHGDDFDSVVQHAKWLALLGDWAYRALLASNTLINRVRRRLGFGYWSFSAFAKTRVKKALQFIENFEQAVADEARRRGVDGVICGHIHKAESRMIDGVAYINDGDWVGELHGADRARRTAGWRSSNGRRSATELAQPEEAAEPERPGPGILTKAPLAAYRRCSRGLPVD